jgi:hypothetical protein
MTLLLLWQRTSWGNDVTQRDPQVLCAQFGLFNIFIAVVAILAVQGIRHSLATAGPSAMRRS